MNVFGALCAFLACTIFGCMKAYRMRLRTEAVRAILGDIKQLGLLLEFSAAPVGQLLMKMKNAKIPELWAKIAELVDEGKGVKTAWECVRDSDDIPFLSVLGSDEMTVLNDFFDMFGASDFATQKKNFALAYSRTEELKNNIESESAKKERVFSSIGLMAGIAFALLIW